jgi:hypothetical protein
MTLPDEWGEKIFREITEEIKEQEALFGRRPRTFDELEGAILEVRKRFTERLMQAALEYEEQKAEKKTAPSAEGRQRAMDDADERSSQPWG